MILMGPFHRNIFYGSMTIFESSFYYKIDAVSCRKKLLISQVHLPLSHLYLSCYSSTQLNTVTSLLNASVLFQYEMEG